jgi:hypothetical protein
VSSSSKLLFTAFVALGGFAQLGLSASTTGLNDWCFNLNGNTSTACNGTSSNFGSGSTFDTTRTGTGPNALGAASFSLAAGQFALAYMDYDLDVFASPPSGPAQDSGSANGVPVPGVMTYELDDPNASNIFTDFSNNALMNTNNVGSYGAPPNPCCDVSWALGFQNTTGLDGTITFTVSTSAPLTGFYLQQTNGIYGDSIYLSAAFTPSTVIGQPVPEPAVWTFAAPALFSLFGLYSWKRRNTIAASR